MPFTNFVTLLIPWRQEDGEKFLWSCSQDEEARYFSSLQANG